MPKPNTPTLYTKGEETLKLTFKERLITLGLLPTEGDITTIRTLTELRTALQPTAEEVESWEIRSEDNQIFWNQDAEESVDIKVNAVAKMVIVAALNTLNTEKKLTADHLDVYELFVEEKEDATA